jgi:PAS domain S-box-containing protein
MKEGKPPEANGRPNRDQVLDPGEDPRNSAERYRLLFEHNLAGVYRATVDGEVLDCNASFARILGYSSPDEVRRRRTSDFYLTPADREAHLARLRELGSLTNFELCLRRKDGRPVWVLENASLLPSENGRLEVIEATLVDITDRKRMEEALRQAERNYRGIIENAAEGIFQTTPEGAYLSVNPALARIYGYDSPEELKASVTDIGRQIYAEPKRRAEFKRLMEEQGVVERFEYQVCRKDGARIWLSENARAVRDGSGRILYYEGTVEDITDRKRVEAERQVMFEIIHGANVTANLDELLHLIHESLKKVLYAENCFVALYDSETETFGFPFFVDQYDTVPPPLKVGRSCTAYVFRTGRPQLIPEEEFQRLVAQGEVELVGTPSPTWIGVPLKTPAATIGVLVVQHYEDPNAYSERDLELLASVGGQIALAIERKRTEEALRENETRLRLLIEQLPAILWTTDADLKFTSSLGAGLASMGLKPNQLLGMPLFEFFNSGDPDFPPIAAHRRALQGEAVTFEVDWNGRLYESHVEPLRGAGSRIVGTVGMALDVSERRRLEDQLRQAHKMEAVGRLAGGVAHDFNNLLMVIRGYGELLLEGSEAGDPVYRSAEQIQKAADRAASLTRQLLAFSRKQVLAPAVLDINAVVTDIEKMLQRLIGEDIELVTVARPGVGRIKADRGQIEQVILNLAVNARDAMPRGGKLTIETANVELDEEYCRRHAVVQPGSYVMIAVTDTGVGMDAETRAHIFEPFFTTKGLGTGLGLATVYGVVKQSGGYIWVYSELGQGTTFKVYLPRLEEGAAVPVFPRVPAEAQRGYETVLVVEDEDGVRELAREFLERHGYTVLTARSGPDALALAQQRPGPIHLLITDVVMPGMSGRELAEKMAQLRPELRVLFMSGYTDDAIVQHGILDRGTALLQKPFTRASLAAKVRESLGVAQTVDG